MLIRIVNNDENLQWDDFVRQNSGSFLQSSEYAQFRQKLGNKVWQLVVEDNGLWLATAFLYQNNLKLKQNILYCPKGPVVNNQFKEIFKLIIAKIDEIARQEKSVALQIDIDSNEKQWCEILDSEQFNKSADDIQPRHTLLLHLGAGEEEILSQMHQKTRYNINLAQKKGVEIAIDNCAVKDFLQLLKKTEKRQQISMFSEKYFTNILQIPFVKLYTAKYQGHIIAANIMVFFGGVATYLFGASDYEYRAMMAPYLLQWQAIKDAKAQNCRQYDFWGAAPGNATGRETNWAGFTRFKMGFSPGAQLTEYLGTYEKAYSPIALGIYRFLQKFNR